MLPPRSAASAPARLCALTFALCCLRRQHAPSLVRVRALAVVGVSAREQHRRIRRLVLGVVREEEIRRHMDVRPAFEIHFLDNVAVALHGRYSLGVQRAALFGKPAHGLDEIFANALRARKELVFRLAFAPCLVARLVCRLEFREYRIAGRHFRSAGKSLLRKRRAHRASIAKEIRCAKRRNDKKKPFHDVLILL